MNGLIVPCRPSSTPIGRGATCALIGRPSADDCSLVVHAYRREEVESIGDELVGKLTDIGMPDGVTISWTADDGERVVRPV